MNEHIKKSTRREALKAVIMTAAALITTRADANLPEYVDEQRALTDRPDNEFVKTARRLASEYNAIQPQNQPSRHVHVQYSGEHIGFVITLLGTDQIVGVLKLIVTSSGRTRFRTFEELTGTDVARAIEEYRRNQR